MRRSRCPRFSGQSESARSHIRCAPLPLQGRSPFAAGGLTAPATVRDGSSYGRPSLLGSRSQLHTPQKRHGSVDQRVLILHRPPNSVPPNNAMHLTRREGAAVRSLRPVVEARLAGDRGCWTELLPGRVACSRGRGPDGPEGQVPQRGSLPVGVKVGFSTLSCFGAYEGPSRRLLRSREKCSGRLKVGPWFLP